MVLEIYCLNIVFMQMIIEMLHTHQILQTNKAELNINPKFQYISSLLIYNVDAD